MWKHIQSRYRAIARAAIFTATLVVALVAGELIFRRIDGYRILSLQLTRASSTPLQAPRASTSSAKWRSTYDAAEYVRAVPHANGVEPLWYQESPPPQDPGPADADLLERAAKYTSGGLYANYEWNRRGVFRAVCDDEHRADALFNQFRDVFVFDAVDGSQLPAFRFLQHARYPTGLKTNNYGFRGRDIALDKPPTVVRVGFVGASTTIGPHAEAYSYPDLVGHWLNVWAQTQRLPITFEVVNAAREGTNSRSFQAIVRQELVPLQVDLVVYYEGANQFWPVEFIPTTLPPRSRSSGPQRSGLARYSVIARRLASLTEKAIEPGSEPSKPTLEVRWPASLSESDPSLGHPALPESIRDILGDLDKIRAALQDEGGHLVMTSFSWLVYPGLVLDMGRDPEIYHYLNSTYWPFSYAHLRRFADFQNRTFQKYASVQGLDFIDVAQMFPRDPRLFEDAIHMTTGGIRLQAWTIFNGLVPIIERRVAKGELPKPNRNTSKVHPAFATGRQLVEMDTIRGGCSAAH